MIFQMTTSKGEQKIIDILTKYRIRFKREVSFKNLNGAHNKPLRFDFAIFSSQGKFLGLIEFDGIQHFQYTPYFHKSKNDFHRQIEWDRKKNKFCLLNDIPLIRIPYWDIDNLTINSILHNNKYRVKNKDHNLMLAREVRK